MLPSNSSIQLSFDAATVAAIGGPHPFHLHGVRILLQRKIYSVLMTSQHTFDVIRPQGSTVYNYANPVRRDVVATGTGSASDNVTIRFQTDNAGPCECRNIRIFFTALT